MAPENRMQWNGIHKVDRDEEDCLIDPIQTMCASIFSDDVDVTVIGNDTA